MTIATEPASQVETPITAAAVEEQLGKIMTDLGGALGLLLISAGTRAGLWRALAGAGPLTVEQAAAKVSVDPALVREWLRAQAAGGYLEYDASLDTFTLPDAVAGALLQGPGAALVEACVEMLCSMGECFDDYSAAFASGKGFGWHQRNVHHWHGEDAFTRTVLPVELVAAALEQLPGIGAKLRAGGSVVDAGCGYGTPTLAIAALYPSARVLGTDFHDASIMAARDAAARAGRDNIRFEVAAATHLPAAANAGGYALVTFFDSLHDMGDAGGALRRARQVLEPDGAVLLFEPLGADRVADNLNPNGRVLYSISTLACTPNAVSQRTATSSEPLGAQAGEAVLRALAAGAGFGTVRRLDLPAPMNLVLELRP
jgi:SAM-dependent methyltransferase